MREGRASIHFTYKAGDARHLKSVETFQLEAGLPDEATNRSVHVTAHANFLLQGIQAILPFRGPRTVTAAVLEEDELKLATAPVVKEFPVADNPVPVSPEKVTPTPVPAPPL